MKSSIYFFIAVLLFQSCATVPVTGRRQLDIVSSSEINNLSATQYQEVIKTGPLSTNTQQTEMIKRVGKSIQGAVEQYMASKGWSDQLSGFNWEFNLIQDDKTINAWCMPGGKVAFYSAILPVCKNENGIAVVMGHEVAHAIANHGRERMSQGLIQQYGVTALNEVMGKNPSMANQLFQQAVGMGSNLGMLSFSRQHESEADHIGLIFMAMAGYDPNLSIDFWKRMIEMSSGQKPPVYLSDHPSDEERIKALQGWMPEALKYYKK